MATHRPIVFLDREEFETHILTEHKSKLNQSQLATLSRRSARPATHAFDECPLCKAQAVEVNSAEDSPKDVVVNDRLPRHVAGHLKTLALMFLPPRSNSGEEESDKSGSLSTRISSRCDDADPALELPLAFDDEGSLKEDRDDNEWNFVPRGTYEGHNHDIVLRPFLVKQSGTDIELARSNPQQIESMLETVIQFLDFGIKLVSSEKLTLAELVTLAGKPVTVMYDQEDARKQLTMWRDELEGFNGFPALSDDEQGQIARQLAAEILLIDKKGLWAWDVEWEFVDYTIISKNLKRFVEKEFVEDQNIIPNLHKLVEVVEDHLKKARGKPEELVQLLDRVSSIDVLLR